MSLSARWHRLDAVRWVHRLLVLQVVLLVLGAVLAAAGPLLRAPVPWFALAAAVRIAWAWSEERRWSWWGAMVLAALGAAGTLSGLASGPSLWRVAWLLFDAVLLALLAHPDSTARIGTRPRPARAPRWVPERPQRG